MILNASGLYPFDCLIDKCQEEEEQILRLLETQIDFFLNHCHYPGLENLNMVMRGGAEERERERTKIFKIECMRMETNMKHEKNRQLPKSTHITCWNTSSIP